MEIVSIDGISTQYEGASVLYTEESYCWDINYRFALLRTPNILQSSCFSNLNYNIIMVYDERCLC